jgi:hypothetical protein
VRAATTAHFLGMDECSAILKYQLLGEPARTAPQERDSVAPSLVKTEVSHSGWDAAVSLDCTRKSSRHVQAVNADQEKTLGGEKLAPEEVTAASVQDLHTRASKRPVRRTTEPTLGDVSYVEATWEQLTPSVEALAALLQDTVLEMGDEEEVGPEEGGDEVAV